MAEGDEAAAGGGVEGGGDFEAFEGGDEAGGLVLAQSAEAVDGEVVFGEEVGDGGGSVVAGWVVGASSEAFGSGGAIADAIGLFAGEGGEVGEPAGVEGAHGMGFGGYSEPAAAFSPLGVFVATSRDEDGIGAEGGEVLGHDVEGMVGVEQDRGADSVGCGDGLGEVGHDRGGSEEHGRGEEGEGVGADGGGHAGGEGGEGFDRDEGDVGAGFGEAEELAAEAVEFAVGGDEVAASVGVEGAEEAGDEFVAVRGEGDLVGGDGAVGGGELGGDGAAEGVGAGGRAAPFVVDVLGGVGEGFAESAFGDVGPGLVAVAGEEDSAGAEEAAVVGGERVGVDGGHRGAPRVVVMRFSRSVAVGEGGWREWAARGLARGSAGAGGGTGCLHRRRSGTLRAPLGRENL